MRWDALFIAGLGGDVPEPSPVQDAVAAGLLDAERFKTLGYSSICVDEVTAPPDRAVAAARLAMGRADLIGRDLCMLLHGSLWFQGLDIWPAGSYIAAQAGARPVPCYDVAARHAALKDARLPLERINRIVTPATGRFKPDYH